jgi:hypothetical protein
MPSLRDTTFSAIAWKRLAVVAGGLATLGLIVWLSVDFHRNKVELPRLMKMRHIDPLGHAGLVTAQITGLGELAVPTLLEDLSPERPASARSKSIELLSGIDDPRVIPTLGGLLRDKSPGVRIAALSGLARTARPEAAEVLWPQLDEPSGFFRYRAIVVLGLVVDEKGVERLYAEARKVKSVDRYLLCWAAGYASARHELTEKFASVKVASAYDRGSEARALQTQIDEIHGALDRLEDLPVNCRRLSALTNVGFQTWDFAHQIGYQVLAAQGPISLRGLGAIDPSIKTASMHQILKLKKRPRP